MERKKYSSTPEWKAGKKKAANADKYSKADDIDAFEDFLSTVNPSDLRKIFMNQGAIPKRYNLEHGDTQSCQKRYNGNPYKWYKNRHVQNVKLENNSLTSTSSLESNTEKIGPQNSPRSYLPFYYIVPENPSKVNILSPGKYLVIPQNVIPNKPLRVVSHPRNSVNSGDNEKKDQKYENCIDKRNRRQSYRKNEKSESQENESRKQTITYSRKPFVNCENKNVGENGDISGTLCKEHSHTVYVSESSEHSVDAGAGAEFRDAELASLIKELPYYDENFIRSEWNKKKGEMSVDSFLDDMRDRRINEVYMKVLSNLPHVDDRDLFKKIPEIFASDVEIENFIENEWILMKQKVLEAVSDEIEDVTMDEIHLLFNRFGDTVEPGEEKMVELFKSELKLMRADEIKVQKLQMISAILPDVDPVYVLSKLNEWEAQNYNLNDLIGDMLENPDYPKAIEHDPKTREKHKLWKYYVTNYSVENFLRKLSDPQNYFSVTDGNNRKINRDAAVEFLGSRYPDLDNYQLNQAFTDSNESLLKTCTLLDKNYMYESVIDDNLKNKDINEEFLREITFIVHKEEILKHIREEKERRELELQQAEEENSFFECVVCYDFNVIPSEVVTCPEGHITCRFCLIKYIKTSFGEGKATFPCPSFTCDSEFTMNTIEKNVDPDLFSKIAQRRAADEVDKAAVAGLEKCPSCDYAYVPAPEDKIFTCSNEDCLRVTCRLCKELNHIPLSCKEIERPKDLHARQQVEEAMTEKLVRSCPSCRKKFIKIDGCNKIACVCGTICCYICLQIVKDYSHFNGQGGTEFHKCPLYSENKKLHVEDVLKAGIETKERIMRENPDINFLHDPTVDG